MASDITITSLTAVGNLGSISVTVLAESPALMSCLSYMLPTSVDIYSSATNSWGAATLVGTVNSAVGVFIHPVTGDGVTRYYWAIPRDNEGNAGARYPATTTGVSATTKTAEPGPNSVGPTELQDGAVTTQKIANLAVTNAKIVSLNADKIVATQLSAISANLGTITAGSVTGITFTGGTFRTAVSGQRIEILGSTNRMTVYNSAGVAVGWFNDLGFGTGVLRAIGTEAEPRAATFNSNTSGGANNPAVNINRGGSANAPALDVTANGTGGNGHAIRAFNNNGGSAALAVSSASGGYGVLVVSGGYGPFTGAHDAFIAKDAEIDIGDIVCDDMVISRNGISDAVTEVYRSNEPRARNVAGVVAARVPFEADATVVAIPDDASELRQILAGTRDRLTINGVGEGQVNVCGLNGNISAGDYITTSALPGKGQRQDDDIKRSCTVARARENVVFDYPEQVKRVACFYECG